MRRVMLRTLRPLLWLAPLVLALPSALAQDQPLHDVRVFKVTMPAPDEQGQSCGLERQALERAFFEPLGKRGLGTAASGTGYRLALRTTTIAYLEGSCVTYAEAQLLLATRYVDGVNQQEQSGNVLLWHDGGLYASDSREHAAAVERAMRTLGDDLGARWDAANAD